MKTSKYLARYYLVVLVLGILPACSVHAAWDDIMNIFTGDEAANGGLSNGEIITGLKEALTRGSQTAISSLGQTDGFYRNRKVKIRMPDRLEKVEKLLRNLNQDEVADEFVLSMNRAAEQAVPEVTDIFSSAIREMTISDARNILGGPDDAATQYFRRTSGRQMTDRMLPIVSQSTSRVGVTSKYKKMVGKLDFAAGLIDTQSLDLDRYVTEKAVDGLFSIMAEQERLIRHDPAARTTAILKKVFGH